MAELLIRAVDRGANPKHWKRGDIVYVAEDDHPWGAEENERFGFYILKVPGVPATRLRHLKGDQISDNTIVSRCAWKFDPDALGRDIVDQLDATGRIEVGKEVDREQVEDVFLHKETRAKADLR